MKNLGFIKTPTNNMNNRYFLLTLLIFGSCKGTLKKDCDAPIGGHYQGRAMIFFHQPVSGATYELFIFPLCAEKYPMDIEDKSSVFTFGKGVTFVCTSDNAVFRSISTGAHRLTLLGRDSLAKQLQSVNYRIVNVKFHEKESKSDTDGNPQHHRYFSLVNGTKISLSYEIRDDVQIDDIEPLQ